MATKLVQNLAHGDRVICAFKIRTVDAVDVNDSTIADDSPVPSRSWPGVTVHWIGSTHASRYPLDTVVDVE
jgi:hypothetical protein